MCGSPPRFRVQKKRELTVAGLANLERMTVDRLAAGGVAANVSGRAAAALEVQAGWAGRVA